MSNEDTISQTHEVCQLCKLETLYFEPGPVYCTVCYHRIQSKAVYYSNGSDEVCKTCYNDRTNSKIEVPGRPPIQKITLKRKNNDNAKEEKWVQCDKCSAWQHVICSLFNDRRDEDGQAEFICPLCYKQEIEKGEREPLPNCAVLGAKDLPRTYLSDHIEKRLSWRLDQERQERAKHSNCDEVPRVEGLVLRVVSSVDRSFKVKQHFLNIFENEDPPTEFRYKSKCLLLFQKIGGVDVCIFAMYVHEYGSDCSYPNNRHINISYLDSVKYFSPPVQTATGKALRTFVFYEILIGYLEYCKIRGFTTCYIWVSPPEEGDDYIFNRHPNMPKKNNPNKLQKW
eukprot:Gb_41619 [translate_table: standard]